MHQWQKNYVEKSYFVTIQLNSISFEDSSVQNFSKVLKWRNFRWMLCIWRFFRRPAWQLHYLIPCFWKNDWYKLQETKSLFYWLSALLKKVSYRQYEYFCSLWGDLFLAPCLKGPSATISLLFKVSFKNDNAHIVH